MTRLKLDVGRKWPARTLVSKFAAHLKRFHKEAHERDLREQRNDAMKFWGQRLTRYSKVNEFAQDLLSTPASQAYMYVERIFSLFGFLTTGRRNRMEQSLEMRAFLRVNSFL